MVEFDARFGPMRLLMSPPADLDESHESGPQIRRHGLDNGSFQLWRLAASAHSQRV